MHNNYNYWLQPIHLMTLKAIIDADLLYSLYLITLNTMRGLNGI